MSLKEACVLNRDSNATIYDCWAGCITTTEGEITCNEASGITPDYEYCLMKQQVRNLTSKNTMNCFKDTAKLTVNKTMCD